MTGGELRAASDADAVRWVERAEWNSHSALVLDPITVRVIEKGWQMAQTAQERRSGKAMSSARRVLWRAAALAVVLLVLIGGVGFLLRPVSYFDGWMYLQRGSYRDRKPHRAG